VAIEQLQRDLAALEVTPARGRMLKIDPDTATEVMRDVIANADAKKKRAFLGAFIDRIVVSADSAAVDYRARSTGERRLAGRCSQCE
jgi:hypothetical protein